MGHHKRRKKTNSSTRESATNNGSCLQRLVEPQAFTGSGSESFKIRPQSSRAAVNMHTDVTGLVIQERIDAEILMDDGIEWADADEPGSVFTRGLENIWMD
ncbi:hypothetical protein [Sorangium cellulosum]|uniref:hypothetical protein n=1 Tax=Sorangium cellulosum TaxID=56 RepID=UPI0011DDE7BD|nr:hypothetical protein [Sorangium cellulosum]